MAARDRWNGVLLTYRHINQSQRVKWGRVKCFKWKEMFRTIYTANLSRIFRPSEFHCPISSSSSQGVVKLRIKVLQKSHYFHRQFLLHFRARFGPQLPPLHENCTIYTFWARARCIQKQCENSGIRLELETPLRIATLSIDKIQMVGKFWWGLLHTVHNTWYMGKIVWLNRTYKILL